MKPVRAFIKNMFGVDTWVSMNAVLFRTRPRWKNSLRQAYESVWPTSISIYTISNLPLRYWEKYETI